MTPREFYDLLKELPQPEFLYMSLAALALLVLLWALVRRQPKNVVAYSTESGRVMVSRQAIVELVQSSCEQLQDVSKPKVKISVRGRSTHFEIRLKLLSGGSLRHIEQTLQTHLRHTLTENLGIENLGRINILATGFKSGKIESNRSKENALPPEAEPEPEKEVDAFETDLEASEPKKSD